MSFIAQALQGGDGRHWHGKLLPQTTGWLVSRQIHFQEPTHTRQTAITVAGQIPEDLIAWLKLRGVSADGSTRPAMSLRVWCFGFEQPPPIRRTKNMSAVRKCQS